MRPVLNLLRPFRLDRTTLPSGLPILVLGPHPDDFEAMGISLRHFQEKGHPLHLIVLSSSANGVEDSFCRPPTREAKDALREEEQRQGLAFFGLTFRWMRRWAREARNPVTAFLVRDPKTIASRDDAFLPFGEEDASWKAELLRHHRSQQQRNLNTRGHGFDERILRVNRANARRLGIAEPYAEAFEVVGFPS
jgi:hypothetical protein